MKPFFLNIDVLGMGACNLSCPSCPVGNWSEMRNPKGLMDADMLRQILEKARRECEIKGVGLFNYTEPLLHPQLPELVRIVRYYGLRCDLSSNLNKIRGIEDVLRADPSTLRISCSGFTQETYERTHRGGNIETVKANMAKLMEIHRNMGSATKIHVLYHRYRHNLHEEALMREYCESLGIAFLTAWAFFMPLEKMMTVAGETEYTSLNDEDKAVLELLQLPATEALAATEKYRGRDCQLQTEQISLDFQGRVQLCCATYDSNKFSLGNFLEMPLEQIQQKKYESNTCTQCMKRGIHVYYSYGAPEFDEIAYSHMSEDDQEKLKQQQVVFNPL